MHCAAVVTSLSLALAATPDVAENAAHVDESAPIPTTPDDFLAGLKAPVPLENVRAVVELSDDVNLAVDYTLRSVGAVSIVAHGAGDGDGLGLVTVGETVVVELRFAEGSVAWETVDFSALSPAQSHAVAASIVQVWNEDVVTEALEVATLDDRDLKCSVAGNIAGAVTGVGVFAACGIFIKNPVTCTKAGGTAYGYTSFHITNKCNGAQNH